MQQRLLVDVAHKSIIDPVLKKRKKKGKPGCIYLLLDHQMLIFILCVHINSVCCSTSFPVRGLQSLMEMPAGLAVTTPLINACMITYSHVTMPTTAKCQKKTIHNHFKAKQIINCCLRTKPHNPSILQYDADAIGGFHLNFGNDSKRNVGSN